MEQKVVLLFLLLIAAVVLGAIAWSKNSAPESTPEDYLEEAKL